MNPSPARPGSGCRQSPRLKNKSTLISAYERVLRVLKLLLTILNYQEIVAFLYPLFSLKVHESLEKEVGGIKGLEQIYFHVLITFKSAPWRNQDEGRHYYEQV